MPFGRVFKDELEEIKARRQAVDLTENVGDLPPDLLTRRVGVALSGGGLRSASFNLGVLQALDAHGVLRHVDYLSTVSGGGYVGAYLSSVAVGSGTNFAAAQSHVASSTAEQDPAGESAARAEEDDTPAARRRTWFGQPGGGFQSAPFDPTAHRWRNVPRHACPRI